MAAVRRWFMNGTPPSVFRPPSSSETLPSQWPTNISSNFQISCGLVEEKESETIGDTAVLSWMTVHRWFASTQSSAATLLFYRAQCTHCAADAHQWFAFTQSHSIYCIRIKLPGNYIPASIQLAFLYFLYDDMKRESSIAIWISLVIIHISQPRSQRNVVQQCN